MLTPLATEIVARALGKPEVQVIKNNLTLPVLGEDELCLFFLLLGRPGYRAKYYSINRAIWRHPLDDVDIKIGHAIFSLEVSLGFPLDITYTKYGFECRLPSSLSVDYDVARFQAGCYRRPSRPWRYQHLEEMMAVADLYTAPFLNTLECHWIAFKRQLLSKHATELYTKLVTLLDQYEPNKAKDYRQQAKAAGLVIKV